MAALGNIDCEAASDATTAERQGAPTVGEPGIISVLAGFPGPALLFDDAQQLVRANAPAEALLVADRSTADRLSAWLASDLWQAKPTVSGRVGGAAGERFFDWVATALPNGLCLLLGRETTFERRLRQTLTESRQRYKDFVEISSDFAWEVGADGRFVFVSPRGALGFGAEALLNRHPTELAGVSGGEPDTLPFLARKPMETMETWVTAADGHPVCLSVSALPLYDATGVWIGARGVCRDITDQVNRSYQLARMEIGQRLLGRVDQALRDRIDTGASLDGAAEETAHALNAAGCRLYRLLANGRLDLQAEFGSARQDLSGFARRLLEITEVGRDETGPLSIVGRRTVFRGQVNGAILAFRNGDEMPWDMEEGLLLAAVAERVGLGIARLAHAEWLRQLSERDGLTGLFNRRTFAERLAEQMVRETGPSSLLFIDLDNFKAVNDTFGHFEGDKLLKMVANILVEGVRPGDLACRLGGDEFLLWLARTDELAAAGVTERLLQRVEELQGFAAGPDRPLGLSIGIAVRQAQSDEAVQAFIERADQAMYAAKRRGKGGFELARPYVGADGEKAATP